MRTAALLTQVGCTTTEGSRLAQIAELLGCDVESIGDDSAMDELASLARLLADWSEIHDPAGRQRVIALARKLAWT